MSKKIIQLVIVIVVALMQPVAWAQNTSKAVAAKPKSTQPAVASKVKKPTATKPAAKSFTPEQRQGIEKIVREYLLANPEVLAEASAALQAKQEQAESQAAQSAITANKAGIFSNPRSPVVGNPKGSVILVEFFDYQCGHCKEMGPVLAKLLQNDRDLKIIFKEFPIFGKQSMYASKVALAAAEQGKYWPVHEALLATANPMTPDAAMQAARKAGVDMSALRDTMNSRFIGTEIATNAMLAEKLHIQGTPTMILANKALTKFQFIPGALGYSAMQAAIKSVQGK